MPIRRPPTATVALIALCILVFLYELSLPARQLDLFVQGSGAVPRLVLGAASPNAGYPRTVLLTLFTSQFIHAGIPHIFGNMLFLWVFGRAVEDRLGTWIYLPFYLLAGAVAGFAQSLIAGPNDTTPLIGASGAIAGVLGAYLVSYPRAWVTVLVPILFFFWTFDLPAILVLLLWFATQFFNSVAAITNASSVTSGVATWAHVAGFLLGMVSAPLFPRGSAGLSARSRRRAPRGTPGLARLIASVANLLVLLLALRLVIDLLGLGNRGSALAAIADPILTFTTPIVRPFAEFVPPLRLAGLLVETYTLAGILAVYILAGVLTRLAIRR